MSGKLKTRIGQIGLVALMSGVLMLSSCGKQETNKTQSKSLSRILDYVNDNPEHRDLIINYSIDLNDRQDQQFSDKTLENFSYIVTKNTLKDPKQMKAFVLDIAQIGLRSEYRGEIWDELTPEEKWKISREAIGHKSKQAYGVASELGVDVYDKLKETKLYGELKRFEEGARQAKEAKQ